MMQVVAFRHKWVASFASKERWLHDVGLLLGREVAAWLMSAPELGNFDQCMLALHDQFEDSFQEEKANMLLTTCCVHTWPEATCVNFCKDGLDAEACIGWRLTLHVDGGRSKKKKSVTKPTKKDLEPASQPGLGTAVQGSVPESEISGKNLMIKEAGVPQLQGNGPDLA
uniref:Uncharacterized protein n=1 Tax=Sphaerodactylus townsendi TaxID=933632 RepID=A0ACB8E6B8_9SAUR